MPVPAQQNSMRDGAKKPYTPPLITDLGEVVEKTLGDSNSDEPEEYGWTYGWINVIGAIDELRKAPRK